jgi:hypothetical protein
MRQKQAVFRTVPIVLSATIVIAIGPDTVLSTSGREGINTRIENIRGALGSENAVFLKRTVNSGGEFLVRQAQFDKAFGNCFRNSSSGSGNKC